MGGKDWIGLTQGRDPWKALMNTVMNFQVVRFEIFTVVTMNNAIF
jgi:hypothetical protein